MKPRTGNASQLPKHYLVIATCSGNVFFTILDRATTRFQVNIKEALHIHYCKQTALSCKLNYFALISC